MISVLLLGIAIGYCVRHFQDATAPPGLLEYEEAVKFGAITVRNFAQVPRCESDIWRESVVTNVQRVFYAAEGANDIRTKNGMDLVFAPDLSDDLGRIYNTAWTEIEDEFSKPFGDQDFDSLPCLAFVRDSGIFNTSEIRVLDARVEESFRAPST